MKLQFFIYKKQYLYLGLAVLSVCLSFVSYVRAQESNTEPLEPEPTLYEQRVEAQEQRVEAIEEKKEVRVANQDERKAKLSEQVLNRIINLTNNVETRMQAAIDRMENITDRLETRIEKLNAEGIDTEKATESLTLAKTSLENAKNTLAPLATIIDIVLTSETPKDSFKAVSNQFKIVKIAITEAHANLRQSVSFLKEALREADASQGVSEAVRNNTETQTQEAE